MSAAAGALLGYIGLTQKGNMPRLRPIQAITESGYMEIDQATRRSLEITRTLSGEVKGSLLAAIDLTVTSAGGRLLAARIGAPLASREAIMERLDLVSWYHHRPALCDELRGMMKGQPDIDRALSRLSMGHGGPRDLQALAQALSHGVRSCRNGDAGARDSAIWANLRRFMTSVMAPVKLASELAPALADELPLLARDGGFVRGGFDRVA
jgi:DNA mismatch repair protein MutS